VRDLGFEHRPLAVDVPASGDDRALMPLDLRQRAEPVVLQRRQFETDERAEQERRVGVSRDRRPCGGVHGLVLRVVRVGRQDLIEHVAEYVAAVAQLRPQRGSDYSPVLVAVGVAKQYHILIKQPTRKS
jgi:hypothetical protein